MPLTQLSLYRGGCRRALPTLRTSVQCSFLAEVFGSGSSLHIEVPDAQGSIHWRPGLSSLNAAWSPITPHQPSHHPPTPASLLSTPAIFLLRPHAALPCRGGALLAL
ncbi:unnamed protein product [Lota lota]